MGMVGLFPQGVQYPTGSLQQGVYYPQQGVQTLSGPPQGVHLVPGTSQPPVQFTTGVQQQQEGSFPGSVHLGQSPSMPFHLSQLFASDSQGSGQATLLPNAFNTTTLWGPASGKSEHAPAPNNDSPTVSIHPMVTRSHVGTTRPNPRYAGHVYTISPLPRSYKEAFNDHNWRNAMFDEYNALIKNKTWTSVPRPEGANIVRSCSYGGCKPSRTPVDTESKLGDCGTPVVDPTLYRSLAGSLQYLTFTRPDITYAVQQVCLYMHDSREPHFSALKRILRYVQGTLDYGLQLFSSTTDSLIAYSNADWAGCPTT
nr:ribonuclease H-like domain-containing protein [Tanacetum cinerariifolium]